MQKNRSFILSALAISLLAATSCNNTESNQNTSTVDTTVSNKEISISPFDNPSPVFENAALNIKDIKVAMMGKDSAQLTINYGVENYELKSQTPDATTKGCNNSKDGQHIHFILNNGPYTALYEPTHTFTVALNQPQYILSFLSRSYHESLKHKGAGVLKHIQVNSDGKIEELEIPKTPMVFFSRPKGDYIGASNTENILLDYYLWNTDLVSTNNKVKAQINNQTFNLDTWQPMFIKFAPMGELNVTLTIIDNNGNQIEGPNTSVNRVANLANQEPIK